LLKIFIAKTTEIYQHMKGLMVYSINFILTYILGASEENLFTESSIGPKFWQIFPFQKSFSFIGDVSVILIATVSD